MARYDSTTKDTENANNKSNIIARNPFDESVHSMDHTDLRNKIGVELFLSVPSEVVCLLCGGVMREPIKAVDGASYCRICYLSKPEFTSLDKIPHYEPDEEKVQIIAALKCYCWYRPNGCGWLGEKVQWEKHLDNCPYVMVQCQLCQEGYVKIEEPAHRAKCRFETCDCGKSFLKFEFAKHKHECELYLQCAKCRLSMTHSEFENHVNNCEYTFCRICNEGYRRDQMFSHVNDHIMNEKFSGSNHIEVMIEETKNAQNAINLNKISMFALKQEMKELRTEMAELQTQVSGRKDGSLLWMVENVEEKLEQAKLDNQPLYSPPFYSHENGYKMGAKLYLNGDGEATEGYISLYFFIYKGRYDDILVWPFPHKVALHIITFGTEKPKIEIFTPEKTSMSFERPRNEKNIPSGYKRFVPQDILKQETYVKNGNLYIKIVTDTSNMYHP